MGVLLLQIVVILITCRIVGWVFHKMGQPTVIGEILAGILLGPSVLGHLSPDLSALLFPKESLSNLTLLSQFGLILFMYTVGMELNLSEVKKRLQQTIVISHTSIIIPFALGMVLAYFFYDEYSYKTTPFPSFALFIGIAMSITAFPVLARIIQERKLTRTHLGTISLASAANDDITAWCLLAVVVAFAQAGNVLSSLYNILFSILYVLAMLYLVRPILRAVGHLYHNKEVVNKSLVAFMFLVLILSAYLTEMLGLHALFGAFFAGIVMPANIKFRKIMTEKVEDVSLALFLPLFFASSGLRTEIGLLNTPELWMMCGILILVAIIGKFGGGYISARYVGETRKDSLYLGTLMNTRGLMELIVLSIGYEMHILPPSIFAMLVLMTLVTTFMTTPLISLIDFCFRTSEKQKQHREMEAKELAFKVLLSFGRASSGQILLDVAHQMFSQNRKRLELTALHFTVGDDVNPLQTENFEKVSFGPVLYEAKKLNLLISTRYEVSSHASQDICNIVNKEGYDFLLVGSGVAMSDLPTDVEASRFQRSFGRYFGKLKASSFLFSPNALLQDKTKRFIEESQCSVGVFVNRGFVMANHILVILDLPEDLVLLDYTKDLIKTTHGSVSLLIRTSYISPDVKKIHRTAKEFITSIPDSNIVPDNEFTQDTFNGYDFMLIGYNTWNHISEEYGESLQQIPSTLIISHLVQPESSMAIKKVK